MNRTVRLYNTGSGDVLVYYVDASSQAYSVAFIKQLLSLAVIEPRFRLSILNSDETVNSIIPSQDIITGGQYTENYQNGQRRSISVELFNQTGKYSPSINGLWANKKLSFDFGLVTSSGETIWFPRGVYNLTNIAPSHSPNSKNVSLELEDKFSILEGKEGTLRSSYTIAPGRLIQEVIQEILSQDKGNGEVLDPKPFIYHPSFKGKTTQATISKEAGETFGSIILELATQLSAEVFYDQEGHLCFVPTIEVIDDGNKPILYNFNAQQGDVFSLDLDFDLTDIVNIVYVIGNNINGGYCQAEAINDDPSSPLCVQRIGYRADSPVKDNNITTKYLAQERAEYELRQKLILKSSGTLEGRFNPLLLVNNLITITDEYYGFNQERFLLQGISCNIDYSGKMSLSVANIKNLSFSSSV